MIRTAQYIRIVDPAAALFNMLRSAKPERCSHELSDSQEFSPVNIAQHVRPVWTFDKLLGGWSPSQPGFGDIALSRTNSIPI